MANTARRLTGTTAASREGRGRPRVVDTVRARFQQRLGWRLTASYAVVTVAALVIVEAALLLVGAIWIITVLDETGDAVAGEFQGRAVPVVTPLLTSAPPDLNGIDQWLRRMQSTGIVAEDDGPVQFRLDASTLAHSQTSLLIIDRDGNLAGALKQTSVPTSLRPADLVEPVGLDEAVASALAGATTSTSLLTWPVPERLVVAIPVRDDLGTVVGVIAFAGQPPLKSSVVAIAQLLGVIAVAILLLGAVIGTISGYLAARTLVIRFDRIAGAAVSWGGGDFSAEVGDGATDEIGQLGRRLDRMAEQLAELIRAREQLSVVDERNRLSRDLHDSVKQQAFAMSMHLGTARELLARDPAGARIRLDAAYEISRQSQQELTTIISTLRPTELATTTLDQALDRYVAEWRTRTGIAATVELAREVDLPHAVEDALFRVVQEALTNVARHSRATRVEVVLAWEGDGLSLRVDDDGVGFDARRGRLGVGLHSMRERIEAVGGQFTVTSGPDGTRLSIQVDIAQPERS